jgi:hypothetical protein
MLTCYFGTKLPLRRLLDSPNEDLHQALKNPATLVLLKEVLNWRSSPVLHLPPDVGDDWQEQFLKLIDDQKLSDEFILFMPEIIMSKYLDINWDCQGVYQELTLESLMNPETFREGQMELRKKFNLEHYPLVHSLVLSN